MKDIPVYNLPDGNYQDFISGSVFTVSNGKISGIVAASGVAIIYNNPFEPKPTFYVSDDWSTGSFETTKSVKITSFNTTEAYYSINGGAKVAFNGIVDVTLSHPDDNATVTLDIEAWYGDYKVERQFTYVKSNIVITEVIVNNIPSAQLTGNTIAAWVWEQGEDGRWVSGTISGSTFTFSVEESDDFSYL